MKPGITIIIGLFLISCNPTTEQVITNPIQVELIQDKQSYIEDNIRFNFDDFEIMKSQLGEIKIGMTIQEAETKFSGLSKKTDVATSFGFGGGSPAYLYYNHDEVIFGLIPKLDTDTLLFIIAAHKGLKTANRLGPGSSVNDIMAKHPRFLVFQDLMNGWEVIPDDENGWEFVFMTTEENQIGEYPELEAPSKPVRLTKSVDWVTIL
jgi:hypothetical protein